MDLSENGKYFEQFFEAKAATGAESRCVFFLTLFVLFLFVDVSCTVSCPNTAEFRPL